MSNTDLFTGIEAAETDVVNTINSIIAQGIPNLPAANPQTGTSTDNTRDSAANERAAASNEALYTETSEVIIQPGQIITILNTGSGNLIDASIFLEGLNSLPPQTVGVNVNMLFLSVNDWRTPSNSSKITFNTNNFIFTCRNRTINKFTATNNYLVPITLHVTVTVKTYDPKLVPESAEVVQIIGLVSVLAVQNVGTSSGMTVTGSPGSGTVTYTNIGNFATALVTIHGTYSSVTVSFMISDDDTNFYPVSGYLMDGGQAAPMFTFTASLGVAIYVPVLGAKILEVVVTIATGSVIVNITPISTSVSEYLSTGQELSIASAPVVIASDQSAIATNLTEVDSLPVVVIPLGKAISANSVPVTLDTGYTTLISGQQSVTTGAVQLPSHAGSTLLLKADDANTAPIYIGFSSGLTTSNGYSLTKGYPILPLTVTNLNVIWVISGSSGQILDYIYCES
jgi:hypothetical protein